MDINKPQDGEWPETVKQSKILHMQKSQFKQRGSKATQISILFKHMNKHKRKIPSSSWRDRKSVV